MLFCKNIIIIILIILLIIDTSSLIFQLIDLKFLIDN